MAVISLQEAMDKALDSDFWKLRGLAVQAYASLEQRLCSLFAMASETNPEIAAIIFFKITNADARNGILDKLIRRRFGTTYNPFWNPALRRLKAVDRRRNEIVHWNALNAVSANEQGETVIRLTLRPGAARGVVVEGELTDEDLAAFAEECDYLSRVLSIFRVAVSGEMSPDDAKPWLAAFETAFVYPPEPGSKLDLSPIALGAGTSPEPFYWSTRQSEARRSTRAGLRPNSRALRKTGPGRYGC